MDNNNVIFPDCWEEVLPCEWQYLLKLRYKLMTQPGVTLKDIKVEWCRFVLHNRGARPDKSKTDFLCLIYELSNTLDWMWKVNSDQSIELTFNSTANLLPRWGKLVGPLSHGGDLTFAEFRHAVILFNQYNETQEPIYLSCLVGMLYRKPAHKVSKKAFNGQYRENFVPARIDLYASRVNSMPQWVQYGVYVWFAHFCDYLLTGDFIVEGSQVCFAPVFERKKDSDGDHSQSLGMNAILFSVAESGIFGKLDEADQQPLLRIMLKLLDDKQRTESLMSKTKSL